MPAENDPLKLTLKNNLDEVKCIWSGIETKLKDCCMTRRELFQINLAVDELFTNIVSYAFEDQKEHDICVNIRIENNHIVVELEDDGIPFNPLEFTPHDLSTPLSERAEGGLGIHFCKRLTAEFCYERQNNKNRVTFKKRIKKPGLLKKLFSCGRNHGN